MLVTYRVLPKNSPELPADSCQPSLCPCIPIRNCQSGAQTDTKPTFTATITKRFHPSHRFSQTAPCVPVLTVDTHHSPLHYLTRPHVFCSESNVHRSPTATHIIPIVAVFTSHSTRGCLEHSDCWCSEMEFGLKTVHDTSSFFWVFETRLKRKTWIRFQTFYQTFNFLLTADTATEVALT